MKFSKLLIFTIISTLITDSIRYTSWVGAYNANYSTYIIASLTYISIIIIAFLSIKLSKHNDIKPTVKLLFLLWLYWNIFNIIRGGFKAENYWDWKFLVLFSISFSLIALLFFIGNYLPYTIKIIRFYLKYIFTFGFLIIPLALATNEELYSRLMIPIGVFILFIPYLKPRWRLLIIIVAAVSILMVIGFRSNLIKIFLSVCILSIFYFRIIVKVRLLRVIHFLTFVVPIALLFLATFSSYNIFTEISKNDRFTISNNYGNIENLTTDTRTFLYKEVFSSMNGINNWIIGKSSSGSYKSDWFYDDGGAMKGIRNKSEVNILNILLYHGLIGIILYFILLYKVSYNAIVHSNNLLSKMLGILIATRWPLSFIEEYSQYDLNFYFFWLVMGLVCNNLFRQMTDKEVKSYLNPHEKTNRSTSYLPQSMQ